MNKVAFIIICIKQCIVFYKEFFKEVTTKHDMALFQYFQLSEIRCFIRVYLIRVSVPPALTNLFHILSDPLPRV